MKVTSTYMLMLMLMLNQPHPRLKQRLVNIISNLRTNSILTENKVKENEKKACKLIYVHHIT